LAEGREPDRIGFFSFTRKATNEAIERASVKFKLARKDLKWFRTLHSLSYKWLGCTLLILFKSMTLKEFKKTIEEEWAKETGKITDEEESKMSGI